MRKDVTDESGNLSRTVVGLPPGLGQTILVKPGLRESAAGVLSKVFSVWKVVAEWGTWRNEELGEWPSDEKCISSLPEWFHTAALKPPTFNLRDWLSDLHDREWLWWQGSVVAGLIKIDLVADSLPISTWMLTVVIEAAGGVVVYRDKWVPTEMVQSFGELHDTSERQADPNAE